MTTKPKTRTAPAAKPATPKPVTRHGEATEQGCENEISKLIARWNYLEADRKYQAAIAATKEDANSIFNYLHGGEKGEIKANSPTWFRRILTKSTSSLTSRRLPSLRKFMTGKRLKRK